MPNLLSVKKKYSTLYYNLTTDKNSYLYNKLPSARIDKLTSKSISLNNLLYK